MTQSIERFMPLEPRLVTRQCLSCGGEMKATGMVLTSHPPQYPHTCGDCGAGETFPNTYPRVQFFLPSGKPV